MVDTPNKRGVGQFEPPPWEREQFEEFQRKRKEQEGSQQASKDADQQPTPPVQASTLVAEAIKESPAKGTPADEKVVAAMLLQLQAEEPAHNQALWKVGVGFSVGATAIGLVLLVWGLVAMIRTGSLGAAGIVGSAILMTFGGLFIGLGIWTAVRSLKQRGVL